VPDGQTQTWRVIDDAGLAIARSCREEDAREIAALHNELARDGWLMHREPKC
jgi:hypothetical protein